MGRRRFNPQLLVAIPFCAALATLAVVGIYDGARRGFLGVVLLGLAAAGAVFLLAWPVAGTLFGRELLTLDRDHLSWRRHIGKFGLTRKVPVLAIGSISVQNLGVMAIAPNDVGWCLVIAAHPPYKSIIVGAGFMHDEQAIAWLKDHFQSGLESTTRPD